MPHSLKPVWRPWTRLAATLASSSKRTGQGCSHSHLHGQREDKECKQDGLSIVF